ncbi:MAG: hypothetical protein U0610_32475 [bacterium]
MSDSSPRMYRAGDAIDDRCRVCKDVRAHHVIVAGERGVPIRVVCDTCGSQHNYRHAGDEDALPPASPRAAATPSAARAPEPAAAGARGWRPGVLPIVTERERRFATMSITTGDSGATVADLELLLRRVIREETGLGPAVPADKWRGGEVILKPGKPGLQEKSWPIDTLFHKVVMIRDRLRVLEQQINGADLPEVLKVKLQGYVTGCYGSLTSFNVLFADEDDKFAGSSGT